MYNIDIYIYIYIYSYVCTHIYTHVYIGAANNNQKLSIRHFELNIASYTAQGPQKQPEIIEHLLYVFRARHKHIDFWTWNSVSRPLKTVPVRKFHIESELEVRFFIYEFQRRTFRKQRCLWAMASKKAAKKAMAAKKAAKKAMAAKASKQAMAAQKEKKKTKKIAAKNKMTAKKERAEEKRSRTIVSFVEGPLGAVQAFLGDEDEPGLYMLLTHQGFYHGNQPASADAVKFPVLKMDGYTDAALQVLLRRVFKTYHGVFVCVQAGKEYRDQLLAAWYEDLALIGGSLPPGKPNSQKWGIQRSNGLTYGKFARMVRANIGMRRVWHLLTSALGRISPWDDSSTASLSAPVITSFDGILFTDTSHHYASLKRHRDVYRDEPGQLQSLTVVHPPPKADEAPKEAPAEGDTRRLGMASAFYANNTKIWRPFVQALLTRYSTSPHLDLRQSPQLSLGSGNATLKQRQVLGGPRKQPDQVANLTLEELKQEARGLPTELQELIPAMPVAAMPEVPEYLKSHGYTPLTGVALEEELANKRSDNDTRKLALHAVAGGWTGTTQKERKLFSHNILGTATGVVARAQMFSAPEKLSEWCAEGGRKKRCNRESCLF